MVMSFQNGISSLIETRVLVLIALQVIIVRPIFWLLNKKLLPVEFMETLAFYEFPCVSGCGSFMLEL